MQDSPYKPALNWVGYFHKRDKTMLPNNVLTYPSKNCFIPNGDKVVPRSGSHLFGQSYVVSYSNLTGTFLPHEEITSSDTAATGLIWFMDGSSILNISNVNKTFNVGVTIIGGTSGATATVVSFTLIAENFGVNGHKKKFKTVGGIEMEVKTFRTSDARNDVVQVQFEDQFVTITEDPNPIPAGQHETYFDSWSETNLDPALSKNLNRLVWVNGYQDQSTKKGAVYSWTGGIVRVVSLTGTTLSITTGTSWRSLGFTENATGGAVIVVNETSYTLSNPSDLDTDTIDVTNTAGISIGDIASSQIEVDIVDLPFDMCRAIQGYMFYGNWRYQDWYMSNAFDRLATGLITASQAFQNDLILPSTSVFTGTGSHVYVVTIDSTTPGDDTQTFTGTGSGTSKFVTSGYTGIGNNEYQIRVISDTAFTPPAGATSFIVGENLVGQTSGAIFKIVFGADNAGGAIGTQYVSGSPQIGETYKASQTLGTVTLNSYTSINSVQIYKNGVQKTGITGMINGGPGYPAGNTILQFGTIGSQILTPAQLDGLDFVTTQIGGDKVGDHYDLKIQTEKADTFQWSFDGVVQQTFVPISPATAVINYGTLVGTFQLGEKVTGGTSGAFGFVGSDNGTIMNLYGVVGTFVPTETITGTTSGATAIITTVTQTSSSQALSQGVEIQFASSTGHNVGDTWTITVDQAIDRAWKDFYYTVPVRKPGEGFKFRLPSTFWTMDTQENSMYVNTAYGEWSYFTSTLSSDLQSETISLTPLKQSGSNKVLYPYLTGHMENDLVYITDQKTLDNIGRKVFLELPQVGYLSKEVQDDFDAASFIGGSFEYLNKQLFVTSPKEGTMFCLDNSNTPAYWQPPQEIPENALLTVIGNQLATHSSIRNITNMLFDKNYSNGDNGTSYEVEAIKGDYDYGDRWNMKNANQTYFEGRMRGKPPLTLTVYQDADGCGGIKPHPIKPVYCRPGDRAPFGEGSHGSHPFGSDDGAKTDYVRETYPDLGTIEFYFASLGITCNSISQDWELLSMGLNIIQSTKGNNVWKNGNREDIETLLSINDD